MIMPVQSDHLLIEENKKPENKVPFWKKLHLLIGAVTFANLINALIAKDLIIKLVNTIQDPQHPDYNHILNIILGLFTVIFFIIGWKVLKAVFEGIEIAFPSRKVLIIFKIVFVIVALHTNTFAVRVLDKNAINIEGLK